MPYRDHRSLEPWVPTAGTGKDRHRPGRRKTTGLVRRRNGVGLIALFSALVGLSALASPAEAKPAERSGFTMELGFGFGAIEIARLGEFTQERGDFGFEPHALSLGGFITNDVAILFRWKSTYHFTSNSEGQSAQQFLGTFACHIQWWFTDDFFVAGGLGAAAFGFGFGAADDDPSWTVGLGTAARIGYAFYRLDHHAFKLSLEAIAGFFGRGMAFGQTLNVEWQYY